MPCIRKNRVSSMKSGKQICLGKRINHLFGARPANPVATSRFTQTGDQKHLWPHDSHRNEAFVAVSQGEIIHVQTSLLKGNTAHKALCISCMHIISNDLLQRCREWLTRCSQEGSTRLHLKIVSSTCRALWPVHGLTLWNKRRSLMSGPEKVQLNSQITSFLWNHSSHITPIAQHLVMTYL